MLEDVAEEDPVERLVRPGELGHLTLAYVCALDLGKRLPGELDRRLGVVDPGYLRAPPGAFQEDFTASAAGVEDPHPWLELEKVDLVTLDERQLAGPEVLIPLAAIREEVLPVV